MNQLTINVNHEELLRDYAGYEFVQDDMECLIKRFLHLYHVDILKLYHFEKSLNIDKLDVISAGAGASKFVFGVFVNRPEKLIFGIRLYNSKGFMKEGDKIYENAEAYNVNLETCDQELVEILVDEIRIYEEIAQGAKTGIAVKKVWTRFPIDKSQFKNSEHNQYIEEFIYITDKELKRLFVNLGINAITVGSFIVGYDGKKILERPEFQRKYKCQAIAHICNAMLQTWLFTTKYDKENQIVGRTIVDLKPAQFVIQSNKSKAQLPHPAFIIDIGPAENTDDIYTYFKDIIYMKELVSAFAGEMLAKIVLSEQAKIQAKQFVYGKIVDYLNQSKQCEVKLNIIQQKEYVHLIDEFLDSMKVKLS